MLRASTKFKDWSREKSWNKKKLFSHLTRFHQSVTMKLNCFLIRMTRKIWFLKKPVLVSEETGVVPVVKRSTKIWQQASRHGSKCHRKNEIWWFYGHPFGHFPVKKSERLGRVLIRDAVLWRNWISSFLRNCGAASVEEMKTKSWFYQTRW